ncbi:phosphonate ABC transporter, permease protein PhnE [Vibrio sp. 10N.286.49.C2]|uniref:phosphonate ABC transporter, permease protein PhnE n=1 Tax=unclassified Vibrio TaxID=2614977 RepID=UPI000C8375C1|nr:MULTISPECIES: phosphonate ABC transporter, permease protein PhnE [unclassified Vibrio]PMH36730.1 phosphonate ABC transporter, permease protein PhnE [Vibrio sp. 10N.286.49.C2]PMH54718.1 phosphonate ABC transporter, permease protein PhnE [Vibrio sp. 10N.286.49.B1]PMH80962.1 phosphonate ABC transporter, permease protein PhnE [Vibrio sp. 10N.286.48.B7]
MPFEQYYQQVRRKQKMDAFMWSAMFMVLYLISGHFAEFSLRQIVNNAPAFFDYILDTIPHLSWDVLFASRDDAGHAVPGSLIYWGYRLPIQLPLLWETINVAIAATLISSCIAIILAFLAANNGYAPAPVRMAVRASVAFLRTMPELAWAVMFVMAYGVGTFPGFVALALHTVGSLTKLFYESIETVSNKPTRGLTAVGASPLQRVRFALWPQVKPIVLSYIFLRFEINFRSSTILGLVGAGGIGQELMTNISLGRHDQVSMTLLLIILVVAIIDMLSGSLRKRVISGDLK